MHNDDFGNEVKAYFKHVVPIFVTIFDGVGALSPSMYEWIDKSFDGQVLASKQPTPQGVQHELNISSTNSLNVEDGRERFAWSSQTQEPQDHHIQTETAATSATHATVADPFRTLRSMEEGHDVELRAGLSEWGYYSNDCSYSDPVQQEKDLIKFYILPIVKRNNHKKHNSHEVSSH